MAAIFRPFCFVLALVAAVPAVAADRLVLSTGMREPWTTDDHTGFTNLLITALFRRIGREAEVTFNPAAARALQLADSGTDDGLAARIAGLEVQYPNLIRVPEPIFVNDFIAATLPGGPSGIRNWTDLAPHAVSYINGWQIFEKNITKSRELAQAKDSSQLLSLLKAGRTEIVLHERWQALWHAKVLDMPIHIHEPPLAQVPMYLYLHRRHAALVEPVAVELRKMRTDGGYKTITDAAFAVFTPTKRPQ